MSRELHTAAVGSVVGLLEAHLPFYPVRLLVAETVIDHLLCVLAESDLTGLIPFVDPLENAPRERLAFTAAVQRVVLRRVGTWVNATVLLWAAEHGALVLWDAASGRAQRIARLQRHQREF